MAIYRDNRIDDVVGDYAYTLKGKDITLEEVDNEIKKLTGKPSTPRECKAEFLSKEVRESLSTFREKTKFCVFFDGGSTWKWIDLICGLNDDGTYHVVDVHMDTNVFDNEWF